MVIRSTKKQKKKKTLAVSVSMSKRIRVLEVSNTTSLSPYESTMYSLVAQWLRMKKKDA